MEDALKRRSKLNNKAVRRALPRRARPPVSLPARARLPPFRSRARARRLVALSHTPPRITARPPQSKGMSDSDKILLQLLLDVRLFGGELQALLGPAASAEADCAHRAANSASSSRLRSASSTRRPTRRPTGPATQIRESRARRCLGRPGLRSDAAALAREVRRRAAPLVLHGRRGALPRFCCDPGEGGTRVIAGGGAPARAPPTGPSEKQRG